MRPYGQVLAPDDSALRIDRFLSDIFGRKKTKTKLKYQQHTAMEKKSIGAFLWQVAGVLISFIWLNKAASEAMATMNHRHRPSTAFGSDQNERFGWMGIFFGKSSVRPVRFDHHYALACLQRFGVGCSRSVADCAACNTTLLHGKWSQWWLASRQFVVINGCWLLVVAERMSK
jgi:hypothetical protein